MEYDLGVNAENIGKYHLWFSMKPSACSNCTEKTYRLYQVLKSTTGHFKEINALGKILVWVILALVKFTYVSF